MPSIVVVPDEALWFMPFAMMHDDAGSMLDRCTITMSPSLTVLDQLHRRVRAKDAVSRDGPILVLANPSIASSIGVKELAHADEEAAIIKELFPERAVVLTRSAATVDEFVKLAAGAAIIHVATHGGERDEPPDSRMTGSLLLAPNPELPAGGAESEASCYLSADRVADLDLSADLVVLSACKSGYGEQCSDGVLGLSRAFLVAGAACVLVASIAIDDYSSQRLMSEFYHAYREVPRAGRALAVAQRRMRDAGLCVQDFAYFSVVGADLSDLDDDL
uniref:CHAT domain-containing protein n=1 Tax=Bicosoecida sp. CB-2014 TaxID=1486930 RepID=A0A7S1GB33_9STRA